MNFLLRIVITAFVAFGLSALLHQGIHIDNLWTAFVLAIVLAVLNAILKPILVILTLPITILTLGLFLFVINALLVLMAGKLVDGFRVDGFGWALLFSLLLSILTSLLYKDGRRDNEKR